MLNTIFESATVTAVLPPVNAANTAAATSAWIDLRGYEGQVAIVVQTGVVGATTSITYTFETATDGSGTGNAAITPLNGALTAVDANNDPMTQVAVFEATQLKGYLKLIGTIAGSNSAAAGAAAVGLKKYAS